MFFQELLILCIEGYIELLLSGFIYFKIPENNQDNRWTMHLSAIWFIFLTLMFIPVMFFSISLMSLEEIKEPSF